MACIAVPESSVLYIEDTIGDGEELTEALYGVFLVHCVKDPSWVYYFIVGWVRYSFFREKTDSRL